MTISPGDPNHIGVHNTLAAEVRALATKTGVAVNLPDTAHIGDSGHVVDHNLLATALTAIAAGAKPATPAATGGATSQITDQSVGFTLHRFSANGSLIVTKEGLAEILVMGGGQGGGSEWHPSGQGGGVLLVKVWLTPGTYGVVMGGGGGGGCKPGDWQTSSPGGPGGASTLGSYVGPGGGTAGAMGQGTVSTFDGTSKTYGVNGGAKGVQCGSGGGAGSVMVRY